MALDSAGNWFHPVGPMILSSRIARVLKRLAPPAAALGPLLGAFAQVPAAPGEASGPGPAAIPVKGFLSVEAFELRKEFVLRFDTLAERLGAAGETSIDAGNRARLEGAVGDWLRGKCPVEVDGRPLEMELDRVHFVRPDPEKGLVVEDRETVPAAEALVGAVFAAALDGPPASVRVRWEVFPADGSEAVVEAGVRGQRTARKLSPAAPELLWKNESGLAAPALLDLPPVPERTWRDVLWSGRGAFALAFVLLGAGRALVGRLRKEGRGSWVALPVGILLAAVVLADGPGPPVVAVSPEQADEISYALLRNVYHAFDYRRESDIYDTLAASATGDLLTRIYLEIQRSLQVETQGGARVRVTDVDLRKCDLAGSEPGRFVADCEWVAVGTVTHWGHTHDRVNRYRAKLAIGPVEGRWRLVDLELVSEERI